VLPLYQALQIAQDQGLDLVAVAPKATPPVCRVLDYGKYKYEQAKKERKARQGQKTTLLKEVRFRPRRLPIGTKTTVEVKLLSFIIVTEGSSKYDTEVPLGLGFGCRSRKLLLSGLRDRHNRVAGNGEFPKVLMFEDDMNLGVLDNGALKHSATAELDLVAQRSMCGHQAD